MVDPISRGMTIEREHTWKRVRFGGWILIAASQAVSLVAQGPGVRDEPLVLASAATGFLGLGLLAVGFERILELGHTRSGAH